VSAFFKVTPFSINYPLSLLHLSSDGVVVDKIYGADVEISNMLSINYWIDAACNVISIVWLLIALYCLMIDTERMQLPLYTRYNQHFTQRMKNSVLVDIFFIAGMLLISAAARTRYLIIFDEKFGTYQMDFIKSTVFLVIAWMWRFMSMHAIIHFLMLAIFTNHLADFIKFGNVIIFLSLVYVNLLSEFLVQYAFP
jgi:hypothetical protein